MSRRDALKCAVIQRKCPPYSLQNSAEWQKEYSAHCLICPFCAQGEKTENDPVIEAFTDLGGRFCKRFNKSVSREEKPVRSGDIRLVKSRENPWRDGFYFNPPVVVVLQDIPDAAGCLPVAQTFFDLALAGPGDLVTESLFIETWNLYNAGELCLGPLIDRVENSVVKDVIAMHMGQNDCPDWAPAPSPLQIHDPRREFRKIEQETALFFNDNIMFPPVFHFLETAELMQNLNTRITGIKWNVPPENVWDILIHARFPEEYYPKAAADSDFFYYYHANLYIYEKGEIKEVKAVRAEAECIEDDNGVTCSIFFPELPCVSEKVWAYSYLKLSSTEIIAPETIKTSVKDRSVIAKFKSDCCDTGSLQTALFCHM